MSGAREHRGYFVRNCRFCRASAIPGRAFPAAQPHTELTTIINGPFAGSSRSLSTSSGVFVSAIPHPRLVFPHDFDQLFGIGDFIYFLVVLTSRKVFIQG